MNDDALTINELIERLERMRLKAPEGGNTPVVMPDGEPVCRAALTPMRAGWMPAMTMTVVVLTDRYAEQSPAKRGRRKKGKEPDANRDVGGEG